MKKNIKLISFLGLFLWVAVTAQAQTCQTPAPGCLDALFGAGGTSVLSVPSTINLNATRGAVQGDGKILSLLDAHSNTGNTFTNVLIRYNPDGSLDDGGIDDTTPGDSFGTNGIVYMNWNDAANAFGNAYAIAIQIVGGQERIVVGGSAPPLSRKGSAVLRVERYLPDGSLDASFGANGRATLNTSYAQAMAIQPLDGKILTMSDDGTLVRLNANGTPDSTFGAGGISPAKGVVRAKALGVQSNGRIIAAGSVSSGSSSNFVVARFNTNGSLDDGGRNDSTRGDVFGAAGKATVNFGASGWAFASLVLADDRVLAVGSAGGFSANDFAIARLTPAGQLDASFSGDGKALLDFEGASDTAKSVSLQANGQIVVGGTMIGSLTKNNLALARFNADGTLDAGFGQNGKTVTDFFNVDEFFSDAFIQTDPACNCEKIVMLGTTKNSTQSFAVAARYLP